MTNERTLLRDIYVTLADAKTAREANIHNDEGAAVLHSFFQLFGPRIREALGCEDFAAVRAWKPDEPKPRRCCCGEFPWDDDTAQIESSRGVLHFSDRPCHHK